jgi:hypothetical protein
MFRRRSAALLAGLALCAAPAGLAAPPPPPGPPMAPAASALYVAAAATGDELAAALAEAPGRAALGLRRAAAAALTPLVPEAPLARVREELARLDAWRARAQVLAGAATRLRAFSSAAGGPLAAADRALDAAALLAVGAFALQLVLRRRLGLPGW